MPSFAAARSRKANTKLCALRRSRERDEENEDEELVRRTQHGDADDDIDARETGNDDRIIITQHVLASPFSSFCFCHLPFFSLILLSPSV